MKIDLKTVGNMVVIPVCSYLSYEQFHQHGVNPQAFILLAAVMVNLGMLVARFTIPKTVAALGILALLLLVPQSANAIGDVTAEQAGHSSQATCAFSFYMGSVLSITPGAAILGAIMLMGEHHFCGA